MIQLVLSSVFAIITGPSASAAYLPPPENVAYWCYQGCIDSYGHKHYECLEKCYGTTRPRIRTLPSNAQSEKCESTYPTSFDGYLSEN